MEAHKVAYSPLLWVLLLAGLAVRLVIAPIWTGYGPDVQTFKAWANMAYTIGLPNLYQTKEFLDYPPGYMYVLYILAAIRDWLGLSWDSSAALILIKLPAMIADVVTGYLLYRVAVRHLSPMISVGIAALYVVNPAILINSTVWGQVDSLFMIAAVAYLLMLQEKRFLVASVLLGVAIMLKPQGLLFGPFIVIELLRGRSWRILLKSLATGAGTMLALLLPFGILTHGFGWVFKLYFSTLASYAYASLNAFNLMTLFGGNFIELNGTIMSYQAWGALLTAASLAYCVYLFLRSENRKGAALFLAYLFLAAFFTFGVKMHERYLFYALLPLLTSFIYVRDSRIMKLFALYSATYFINIAYVLVSVWNDNPFISQWDPIMLVISFLHVAFVVYAAWLGWKLFVPSAVKASHTGETYAETKESNSSSKPFAWGSLFDPVQTAEALEPKKRFFQKKDWLLIAGLTAVYSVFALFNLGSMQAPETFWKPAAVGEKLVFDLGQQRSIARLHTYAGVGHGKFVYTISSDGKAWSQPQEIDNDHTKAFTWNVIMPNISARYVQLEVKEVGFTIHEVAFFGRAVDSAAGQEQEIKPYPVVSVKGEQLSADDAGAPEQLIDEQDIVPYTPTFMDGTYFDEIYHARTAYEHLHQIEPYENTHPPLGKVFISAGISLFGMNPFGWRIVGTLFGIAMIPIMYAFGKRLFGRTRYGFIASFLFTFDFMHFAQTRISTIDVYGVFFIMLMFYYMYKFVTRNVYRDGMLRTLVPLGLAGLFFGIGSASKWIVIYGGAGLAFILALTLALRYREHKRAKLALSISLTDSADDAAESASVPSGKRAAALAAAAAQAKRDAAWIAGLPEKVQATFHRAASSFWRPTIVTLAWCLLFYVVIPATIYVLSYIPFMMVPGEGHGLSNVISYQKHMFDYHSKLEATHPFGSPWYEWPFMARPIWYYSGQFLPEGQLSSIVSFGNPLVWWGGLVALIVAVYATIKRRNWTFLFIILGFCSQYLPWVGVPRLTFIYHYFAMVPFLTLLLAYYIGKWTEGNKTKRRLAVGYLTAAFILFVLYYPILSGLQIPASFSANWLRLLPSWNFF